MFDSPASSRSFAPLRSYWRSLIDETGNRFWWALALLVLASAFEALGLLLLLPLLHLIGWGDTGQLTGIAALPAQLLAALGIPRTLPILLALFIGAKLAQAAVRAYSGLVSLQIATTFTSHLRARFYRALMRANWLFVTRQRSSDITHTLIHELSTGGSAAQQLLQFCGLALLALVQVAVAFVLSPAMTALALTTGSLFGLGLRRLRRHAIEAGRESYGARAEMTAVVSEHLAGIKIAKGHGREGHHYGHFETAMNAISRHILRLYRVQSVTQVCIELGALVALGLFVWFAVAIGRVAPAELIVLAFAFSRLLSHATSLQNTWHQLTLSLTPFVAAERQRESFLAAAEPAAPPVPTRRSLQRELRLEQVSFSYHAESAGVAVREIDLVLPARQVTALCGPSGAGKSTIADLVLGLLAPTRGRVLIDGEEIAGQHLHDWRQSVGFVPQETFLFHETIRANLLWAEPAASEPELRAALRTAAAEEFVDRLPAGLDTVVGDRGVRLSGGERQRLALARALLRRPTLLVLDEATSALDPHHERLVQSAIDRLHGELTILVIAHRLSTVRHADRIVVLDHGAVAETGTWDELVRRERGLFQQLVAADVGK